MFFPEVLSSIESQKNRTQTCTFYCLFCLVAPGLFCFVNSDRTWSIAKTTMRCGESDSAALSTCTEWVQTHPYIRTWHCFKPTVDSFCTQINSSTGHRAVEAQALHLTVSWDKTQQTGNCYRAKVETNSIMALDTYTVFRLSRPRNWR